MLSEVWEAARAGGLYDDSCTSRSACRLVLSTKLSLGLIANVLVSVGLAASSSTSVTVSEQSAPPSPNQSDVDRIGLSISFATTLTLTGNWPAFSESPATALPPTPFDSPWEHGSSNSFPYSQLSTYAINSNIPGSSIVGPHGSSSPAGGGSVLSTYRSYTNAVSGSGLLQPSVLPPSQPPSASGDPLQGGQPGTPVRSQSQPTGPAWSSPNGQPSPSAQPQSVPSNPTPNTASATPFPQSVTPGPQLPPSTFTTSIFSPPPETSTMTTLPPGFGVQTLAGFATNAFNWITTTREDGSSTVLPVVAGFALWEVPMIQNVRFQFNWPKFPIPAFSLPCIRVLFLTVGNCDHPPTNDGVSQPSQVASPSPSPSQTPTLCTASQTTSVCQATCAVALLADGSTTTECYTTACSMTTEPCGFTVATSTTVLPTPNLQCPDDLSDDESFCDPDGSDCTFCSPDDPECSSLSNEHIKLPASSTTSSRTSTSITTTTIHGVGIGDNTCTLTTNAGLTSVTVPWWPRGFTILNNDLYSAGLSVVDPGVTSYMQGTRSSLLRWLSATTDTENCRPTIASMDGQTFFQRYRSTRDYTASPSIDHSFERYWPQLWFAHIIDPNAPYLRNVVLQGNNKISKINCGDLHNFFFGEMHTRNGLGDFWNAMPSYGHFNSMVGMSSGLNAAAKGKVCNPQEMTDNFNIYSKPGRRVQADHDFNTAYGKVKGTLTWLQDVWLGMEVLNRVDMDAIMTTSIWRLHDSVMITESLAREECFGAEKFDLSGSFIDFMVYLQGQMNAITTSRVPLLILALKSDIAALYTRMDLADQQELSLYNGAARKIEMFSTSFDTSRWRWTWNSNLENIGPGPGPAPPPRLHIDGPACKPLSIPAASPTTTAGGTIPAVNTQPQPTPSSGCFLDSDCSLFSCPAGQRIACVEFGMGPHAYKACECTTTTSTSSANGHPQPSTSQSCTHDSDCGALSCPQGTESACVLIEMGEQAYLTCKCIALSTSLQGTPTPTKANTTPATTLVVTPSPLPPSPLPPPPAAECRMSYPWGAYYYRVFNIRGWAYDGGKELYSQFVISCGGVSDWTWEESASGGVASFHLSFMDEHVCVEAGIVAAGGPRIQCQW
ncbi:hypothetical protein AB5N19_11911 [Seiridium cardinale]